MQVSGRGLGWWGDRVVLGLRSVQPEGAPVGGGAFRLRTPLDSPGLSGQRGCVPLRSPAFQRSLPVLTDCLVVSGLL